MFQFAGATFVDLPGKAFKDPLAVPEDIQKINLAYASVFTYITAHDTHNRTKIKTLHGLNTPFPFLVNQQSVRAQCGSVCFSLN